MTKTKLTITLYSDPDTLWSVGDATLVHVSKRKKFDFMKYQSRNSIHPGVIVGHPRNDPSATSSRKREKAREKDRKKEKKRAAEPAEPDLGRDGALRRRKAAVEKKKEE